MGFNGWVQIRLVQLCAQISTHRVMWDQEFQGRAINVNVFRMASLGMQHIWYVWSIVLPKTMQLASIQIIAAYAKVDFIGIPVWETALGIALEIIMQFQSFAQLRIFLLLDNASAQCSIIGMLTQANAK